MRLQGPGPRSALLRSVLLAQPAARHSGPQGALLQVMHSQLPDKREQGGRSTPAQEHVGRPLALAGLGPTPSQALAVAALESRTLVLLPASRQGTRGPLACLGPCQGCLDGVHHSVLELVGGSASASASGRIHRSLRRVLFDTAMAWCSAGSLAMRCASWMAVHTGLAHKLDVRQWPRFPSPSLSSPCVPSTCLTPTCTAFSSGHPASRCLACGPAARCPPSHRTPSPTLLPDDLPPIISCLPVPHCLLPYLAPALHGSPCRRLLRSCPPSRRPPCAHHAPRRAALHLHPCCQPP